MVKLNLGNIEIIEKEDGIYAVTHTKVPYMIIKGILGKFGLDGNDEVIKALTFGNGVPVKISDPVDKDADILVSITDDNMKAYIQYIPPLGQGKDLDVTSIMQILVEKYGIDPQFISAKAISEAIDNPMDMVLVAEGIAPENGRNASIVILPLNEVEIDPYAKIDWHSYKKHFITVRQGEVIGKKTPPSKGKDGVDIFGNVIPAKPGRDIDISQFAGEGTEVSGNAIVSVTSGILVVGGRLSVEEILIIEGDLGFGVGNVTGVKHLWVKGDVKSGFVVKVDGKVLVEGSVENASIHAGEGVFVRGIVTGDKAGIIRSKGFVYIKEAHIARIEAEDNVYVETGLYGSRVETMGDIIFVHPRARLRGGELRATGSIYVPIVISFRRESTKLHAGYMENIAKRIDKVRKELVEMGSKKEHLERLLLRIKDTRVKERIRREIIQIESSMPLVEKDLAELSNMLRKTRYEHIYIDVSANDGSSFKVAEAAPYVVRKSSIGRCRIGYKDGESVILPWDEPNIDVNPPVIRDIS